MSKSPLLVRPTSKTGRTHDVTPASAGWQHVGFGLHKLMPGEAYGEETGEREVCLVLVSGKGRFAVDGEIGEEVELLQRFDVDPGQRLQFRIRQLTVAVLVKALNGIGAEIRVELPDMAHGLHLAALVENHL